MQSKWEDFFDAVDKMRTQQKAFFKGDHTVLRMTKGLEQNVDRMLEEHKQHRADAKQQKFGCAQ